MHEMTLFVSADTMNINEDYIFAPIIIVFSHNLVTKILVVNQNSL